MDLFTFSSSQYYFSLLLFQTSSSLSTNLNKSNKQIDSTQGTTITTEKTNMKVTNFVLASLAVLGTVHAKLGEGENIKIDDVTGDYFDAGDMKVDYNPTRHPIQGDAYDVSVLADFVVGDLGLSDPQRQCLNTFRCRINGGQCMKKRMCLGQGPGYSWKPRLCQRKPWIETLALYKTLGPLAGKFSIPKIPDKFPFGECGCCIPPEKPDEPNYDECPWGCAPADYSTCSCALPGEAACVGHADSTGDSVCAYTGTSCVGCNAFDGDKASCESGHANCEWRAHDSKCAAKGTTTSPATDYFGNTCN